MSDFANDVARTVKRERKRAGLSKAALARTVGLSRPTIISIESGRRVRYQSLKKVADFFALEVKLSLSQR